MSKTIISGIEVDFPFKPYAPQIAMMCKIINALKKKENALIESPTGTGKTLALLCSALAWQKAEYKNIENDLQLEREKQLNTGFDYVGMQSCMDDDDDFEQPRSKKPANDSAKSEQNKNCFADLNDPKVYKQKLYEAKKGVPKIYFCSRTHKQLIQAVRELNRTGYSDVKMTILGSREQTCIHPRVREAPNRNEECKSLLRNEHGATCSFYQKLKRYENNASQLRSVIKNTQRKFIPHAIDEFEALAWDIEDIVKIGEDQRFCPYFATTNVLMLDADLIFCPYNYLIDPLVREKVKLNTQGQIILLDEAHNIEDSCRDAASFCVLEEELTDERNACEAAGKLGITDDYPTAAYQAFAELCSNFLRFLKQNSEDEKDMKELSYGTYCKIWSGAEIVAQLKLLGVNEESYLQLLKYEKDIHDSVETTGKSELRNKSRTVESPQVTLIASEQILTFCGFIFKENCRFIDDFKMGLMKQNPEIFESASRKNKRSSMDNSRSKPVVSLKIWCLYPAVAFSDIGPQSWSIILASGTLSPLDTFESELGIPFRNPFRLETAHVLPPERMFVRSVGTGPRNKPLRATHQTMFANEFLDELGCLLFDVCNAVPRGVLCFLPSYRFLETIQHRWSGETGLWSKLEEIKVIFIEPKDNGALKEVMTMYYDAVDNPPLRSSSCTGALFLAVYRGKISEGLDFADDYARVVITVGIPYPNFKQVDVSMKRDYNDKFCTKKKLLNGRQWYETQAYRALNQALGRCLRHKNDWGSLLLVDERFINVSTQSKLSKWIRGSISHSNNFELMIEDLKNFTAKLSAENDVDVNQPKKLFSVSSSPNKVSPSKRLSSNFTLKHVENGFRSSPVSEGETGEASMLTNIDSLSTTSSTDSRAKSLKIELRKRYSFVKQNRFAIFNDSQTNNSVNGDLPSNASAKSWFTVFDPLASKVNENSDQTLSESPIFLGKSKSKSTESDSFVQFDSNHSTPKTTSAKRKLFSIFGNSEECSNDLDCCNSEKF